MSDHENDDNTRTHIVLNNGTMVAHYKIVEKIGAGGMGEVFLAEDTKLKRQVALKFLPTHLMSNADVKTRFVREAQTVAKLNHPNIVSVYEVGEFNGRSFYVMELVDGCSLQEFSKGKSLPIDDIIEYTIQICQGLAEAHRAGIVHRDIKSANIAIDKQNRIKILDFGLAASEGDEKLTKTGSTLGTVAYMSPEQVSGREIDNRSDLFSLGSLIYELIAGQTPFKRDNEGAILRAIVEDNPDPLSRFKADVPEKLQEVVSKLLEKDKELRYQSAEGVIADIKRMLYDSQQSSYSRTISPKKSKVGLIAGIVSAVVIVAAATVFFMAPDSVNKGPIEEDKLPMIAVLPFENLGAAEDEYFADGMTDEITSRLAGINGLGVISRSSSVKFKSSDKSLREIGSELGVQYILEGTVRWSKGNGQSKVRITPQLISVESDRQLWASNYERDLMEIFAVQADIAEKIVEQLGMTLVASDKAELSTRPTENAKAYELYLKGLNAVRRLDFNYNPKSDLDSAVILDPSFALAHAVRSEYYSSLAFSSPESENAKIAFESAQKALKLHPGLAAGHLAMGMYYNMVETNYTRAMEEFTLAKSEMHNNPDLLGAIAYVQLRQGKFVEAQENQRKVVELDPLNSGSHLKQGMGLTLTQNFDEAIEAIDRAIGLEPKSGKFYRYKIFLTLSQYGESEKTKQVFEEALKHVDTMEIVKTSWMLQLPLPDFPWEDLQKIYEARIRDSLDSDSTIYRRLSSMYYQADNREKAILFADSLLFFYDSTFIEQTESPYVVAEYGTLLSTVGECDQAIEYGLRAKELLSVDECHF